MSDCNTEARFNACDNLWCYKIGVYKGSRISGIKATKET